jgi:urate oxidase
MSVRLTSQRYGKSSVRLTKVTRTADRHELMELAIDVALEGDFSESYLMGDNRRVVATDTMKNTVYALAADHGLTDPESFCLALARHFVDRNEHVTAAAIEAAQTPWIRIAGADGRPHRHSFVGGGSERRICGVRFARGADGEPATKVEAGIKGLPLLKTTDSAFRGFPRDEFTTLPETDDRIFATLLDARWTYAAGTIAVGAGGASGSEFDANETYERIRQTMIDVFADHKSLAVQQTLYAMGEAALGACAAITRVELAMPNQHRIPLNMVPLGKKNVNEIFVTTSEPYGLITATLERG